MIEIIEVKTRGQIRQFVNFPLKLYKNNPYYVPTLYADEMNLMNRKKNPALDECEAKYFLAKKDGKLVGRIAGIINRSYNEKVQKKFIRFSRIDMIDDVEVSEKLIEAVSNYGKSMGMDFIHGPWDFNDTGREGMLTHGFDRLSTFVTMYNHEYYVRHIERLGFKKEVGWLEYFLHTPTEVNPRVKKLADYCKKRYDLREVSGMSAKAMVKKYGKAIFEVVNEAYVDLYGVVPLSDRAVQQVLTTFRLVFKEEFISIVVDKNDKVVGIGVAFPSLAEAARDTRGKLFPFGFIKILKALKNPKKIELAMVAVSNEYRNKGVNAIMINKIVQSAIDKKLVGADTNPELESNVQVQAQWQVIEKKELVKKRQTYIKSLTGAPVPTVHCTEIDLNDIDENVKKILTKTNE